MGHYMTKEERIILQTLLDEKRPVSYIARKLGCCRRVGVPYVLSPEEGRMKAPRK